MGNEHQGNELKLLIKSSGQTMNEVSEILGMTRQNLNYHLRKEILDEDFLRLIFNKLNIDFKNVKFDKKIVSQGTEKEELITVLATSKTLVDQVAKLMSVVYKRDVSECKDDLVSSIALVRKGLIGE